MDYNDNILGPGPGAIILPMEFRTNLDRSIQEMTTFLSLYQQTVSTQKAFEESIETTQEKFGKLLSDQQTSLGERREALQIELQIRDAVDNQLRTTQQLKSAFSELNTSIGQISNALGGNLSGVNLGNLLHGGSGGPAGISASSTQDLEQLIGQLASAIHQNTQAVQTSAGLSTATGGGGGGGGGRIRPPIIFGGSGGGFGEDSDDDDDEEEDPPTGPGTTYTNPATGKKINFSGVTPKKTRRKTVKRISEGERIAKEAHKKFGQLVSGIQATNLPGSGRLGYTLRRIESLTADESGLGYLGRSLRAYGAKKSLSTLADQQAAFDEHVAGKMDAGASKALAERSAAKTLGYTGESLAADTASASAAAEGGSSLLGGALSGAGAGAAEVALPVAAVVAAGLMTYKAFSYGAQQQQAYTGVTGGTSEGQAVGYGLQDMWTGISTLGRVSSGDSRQIRMQALSAGYRGSTLDQSYNFGIFAKENYDISPQESAQMFAAAVVTAKMSVGELSSALSDLATVSSGTSTSFAALQQNFTTNLQSMGGMGMTGSGLSVAALSLATTYQGDLQLQNAGSSAALFQSYGGQAMIAQQLGIAPSSMYNYLQGAGGTGNAQQNDINAASASDSVIDGLLARLGLKHGDSKAKVGQFAMQLAMIFDQYMPNADGTSWTQTNAVEAAYKRLSVVTSGVAALGGSPHTAEAQRIEGLASSEMHSMKTKELTAMSEREQLGLTMFERQYVGTVRLAESDARKRWSLTSNDKGMTTGLVYRLKKANGTYEQVTDQELQDMKSSGSARVTARYAAWANAINSGQAQMGNMDPNTHKLMNGTNWRTLADLENNRNLAATQGGFAGESKAFKAQFDLTPGARALLRIINNPEAARNAQSLFDRQRGRHAGELSRFGSVENLAVATVGSVANAGQWVGHGAEHLWDDIF